MSRHLLATCTLLLTAGAAAADGPATFSLAPRQRIESKPGSGRFHAVTQRVSWDAKKTAVIVCDMWDSHHSQNAVRRVVEMAPRMNQVLEHARQRGATIIHAPSDCMATYKDHPARLRAQKTPRAKDLPRDIGKWCHKIPAEEKGKYPLDQSDSEDDDPTQHKAWLEKLKKAGLDPRRPWKSQIATLKIRDNDFISDSGEEIWSVLAGRGIDQVILVGVHTNMCVLGRPFGLRQLAKNGKKVVLMRDMTDTMYNPARAPFVSHFSGTDLIVEHIEKYVCPTITSDQLLGGRPFRFAADRRPHVAVIMAEDEYRTEQTLPEFALKHLGKEFRVSLIFGSDKDRHDIPGLEALDEADVALISVRRRLLRPEQMAAVKRFVAAGKGVVGIRTSSHAFSVKGKVKSKLEAWDSFDRDVFGGNYTGHHGEGPKTAIELPSWAVLHHPILQGVEFTKLQGVGSLYKVSPLAKTATPLLIGVIPDRPKEPIAWVHTSKAKGRVFYTSLGHVGDFKQPAFNRLLKNAVAWAALANK